MNEQKIDFRGQIHQQNHGLVSDCNFELSNHSSQFLGVQQQQPWNNMGIWVQQLTMDDDQIQGGSQSQLQNLGPAKSPSSIMSRFESPASAFYATERCMRFPQYDSSQVGNLASQFPSGQSYDESYSMDSSEQAHADPNFDIRNTLQSVVKSQPNNSYQYFKASEKSNQIPLSNLPGNNNLFTHQQNKLHGDRTTTASVRRPFSPPYKENQDQAGCCNSFTTSPVTPLSFYSQQGKQSPKFSTTYGDSSSSSPALSSKTRIRWNQDLHEKFVECVNRLGGADKATPKAILKMMGLDGLTIFHVKSHLQKYRIAKYMPDSAEGKSEKKTTVTVEPQLDVKTLLQPYDVNFSGSGLHIKEALQLQLDVQRRLHEQLEIQRKLQLRIEEQGKQLKKMFDLQQKSSNSLLKTQNLDITCHEDGPSNTLSDIQVSTPEDSGSTHFPSKIS